MSQYTEKPSTFKEWEDGFDELDKATREGLAKQGIIHSWPDAKANPKWTAFKAQYQGGDELVYCEHFTHALAASGHLEIRRNGERIAYKEMWIS